MYVRGSLDICWQTEGAHARSELVPVKTWDRTLWVSLGFWEWRKDLSPVLLTSGRS